MSGSRNNCAAPETQAIHKVAAMLGGPAGSVERAGDLLTLLRDPVRRTLLESLSRTPSRAAPALVHATGAETEDLYHHLRCLTRSGALTRSRHHTYAVDPAALTAVRCYFDALLALSALGSGTPLRGT